MKKPLLYIVIPCYNEQDVLPVTLNMFVNKLTSLKIENIISEDSRIMFVDDGSKDDTWQIICNGVETYREHVCGIQQSRNRGHQNALVAGMMESKKLGCDCVVTMDCDGQDDINAIDKMLEAYVVDSCQVVYGVRASRNQDTVFKRSTAHGYYKVLQWLGVDLVYDHADYRLVTKPVLDAFSDYEEVNLFLRGIFPLIGFKSTTVAYERTERIAGESKYPLSKMIHLAVDGISSLSVKPLNMIAVFGMIVSVLSFIGCVWAFVAHLTGNAVAGWASTTCIVSFVCGCQLMCTGILGVYIGKIYMEVKHRPRYIISNTVGIDEEDGV